MRGVKQLLTGAFLILMVLCLTLSVSSVWASGGADPHATTVESTGTAGGHGDEGGHGAAGGSLAPKKLKDLMWRVLNFAALMAILVYFGAKPIASGLSGRQKRIKQEVEDLETRKVEAERSYNEFESKLAGMEKEIDTIVDKAIAQAEVEKAKIIEKAEQAADDIKRQAEMAVQNEIMAARRMLKNDIADQAAAMAEELITKNLKAADQTKIIEDYLDKVGAVQ